MKTNAPENQEHISQQIDEIARRIGQGTRITTEEALTLWREAPLWLLARLADGRRRALNGTALYYNRNFHIEPTNVCAFGCRFCSYRRGAGDPEAWDLTIDEMVEIARRYAGGDECRDGGCGGSGEEDVKACRRKGVTEVHIVGGVHPEHDLWFYVELIRRIREVLPDVAVKAYTAVELAYMIRKAGLSVEEGLAELQRAGMQAIPGGGAEIFDPALRSRICPEKGTAEEWLAVHRAAHRLGIPTNATILYGHAETLEQRVDHLRRLRDLQDESLGRGGENKSGLSGCMRADGQEGPGEKAGGGCFNAFIPLKYRARGNRMGEELVSAASAEGKTGYMGEVSVVEDMKMLAMSRIFLDNIPHIKAYWVMYGKSVAEMALAFGADDLDGTIDDSTRIFSMAGAEETKPRLTIGEIEQMAAAAGLQAVERDTFYNKV